MISRMSVARFERVIFKKKKKKKFVCQQFHLKQISFLVVVVVVCPSKKKRKEKSLTLFSPRAVNAYTSSARKQNAYLTIASITRKAALFDAE
jgi:hypothetical protein